jgi:hypothetical protein
MRVFSAEVLMAKWPEFGAFMNRLPRPYNLELLEDPLSGPALRNYLLLTEAPHLLTDLELSPEDVFWGRYYWLVRFTSLRQAITGPDAGLEQQMFQLLERPNPACSPDWSRLESVEELARRGAAEELARYNEQR